MNLKSPYHEGEKPDKNTYCIILFIYNLYAIGNANKSILTESRSWLPGDCGDGS